MDLNKRCNLHLHSDKHTHTHTQTKKNGTSLTHKNMPMSVIALHRKKIREGNLSLKDTSMAGVIAYHIQKGTMLRVQSLDKIRLKEEWANIEDDDEDICLAADVHSDSYIFCSKAMIEHTLRDMQKLPKSERALYMDATFKLGRDDTILGAIGTNSIKTSFPSRVSSGCVPTSLRPINSLCCFVMVGARSDWEGVRNERPCTPCSSHPEPKPELTSR
jgi:hypothetical protein